MQRNLAQKVKDFAYESGFDLVSISTARALEEDGRRYREWSQKGYAGEMKYMTRELPRRWVPQDLMENAQSLITFGVNYFSPPIQVESKLGYGRVARYAWGRDYHELIREKLNAWVAAFKEKNNLAFDAKVMVDSAPLLERAPLSRKESNFIGKNTMLINRKLGSYLFIAELLVDLPLDPDPDEPLRDMDACGRCDLCLKICPTDAFISPRTLDAKRCISYWTIEHRGDIPKNFRPQIGDWIFGCDLCQEVCPYNKKSKPSAWQELGERWGTGPYISLLEIFAMKTDAEFKARFKESPVLRTKRSGIIRNGLIVAVNQKFKAALPLIEGLTQDPDPVVQSAALWAQENF